MKMTKRNDDEILAFIEPFFTVQFQKSCEAIHALCMDHAVEFCEACLMPLQKLFQNAEELQQTGQKSEIYYVYISYLRSSLITGSYEIRVDLYGEDFWLDDNPITEYITIPYLFGFYKEDISEFQRLLKKEFIRFMPEEIEPVTQAYCEYYFSLVTKVFEDFYEQIICLGVPVCKPNETEIYVGEYMGKCVKLGGGE